MYKTLAFSALLLGSTILTAAPAAAAPRDHFNHVIARPHHLARHPHAVGRPHVHFALRHDFRHFTPAERHWWGGGHWRHTWWHGRYGWWWNVGPSWYFYDAPVYPYPDYVSPTYYDDENYDDEDQGAYDDQGYDDQGYDDQGYGDQYDGQDMGPGYGGGGPGTWYHCSKPEGYYPYVKECRNGWEEVPASPSDMGPGPQSGPNNGPPPGYQGDEGDQGPPPGR